MRNKSGINRTPSQDQHSTAPGSPSRDRERGFRKAFVRTLRYRHEMCSDGHFLLAPIAVTLRFSRFAAEHSKLLRTRRIRPCERSASRSGTNGSGTYQPIELERSPSEISWGIRILNAFPVGRSTSSCLRVLKNHHGDPFCRHRLSGRRHCIACLFALFARCACLCCIHGPRPEPVGTNRGRNGGNRQAKETKCSETDGKESECPRVASSRGNGPYRTPRSEGGSALWTRRRTHAEDTVRHQRVTARQRIVRGTAPQRDEPDAFDGTSGSLEAWVGDHPGLHGHARMELANTSDPSRFLNPVAGGA